MVLYITEQYLKDFTNLSNNIDVTTLKPNIIKAQDIYISEFLGDDLDTSLKTKLEANPNGSTLTTNEKALLVIIKKALAEFAAFDCYTDILFKWTAKSAVSGNSENSNSIDLTSLKFVRDIAKNRGEFYLSKIEDFLVKNKDEFTDWYENYKCRNVNNFKFSIDYDNILKQNNFPNSDGYFYS